MAHAILSHGHARVLEGGDSIFVALPIVGDRRSNLSKLRSRMSCTNQPFDDSLHSCIDGLTKVYFGLQRGGGSSTIVVRASARNLIAEEEEFDVA